MKYYIDFAEPLDDNSHYRRVSEPVEFSELFATFIEGLKFLLSERPDLADQAAKWHAVAVEDDGTFRLLTDVEQAGLAAQFEQALGGRRVGFTRGD